MRKSISFLSVLFFALLFLTVSSCKLGTVEPDGTDVGYDYYPLKVGSYIIYEAIDSVYTTAWADTTYEVMERIDRSEIIAGEEVFLVYHYAKATTDTDWPVQPDSVWKVVRTNNQLLRSESNINFIKLTFPVKEGKTWDGNAMNTLGSKIYKMTDLNKAVKILGVTYPKTLKMSIAEVNDRITGIDIRYETVARGIGLALKDYKVVVYKQGADTGLKKIQYGSRKILRIKSYGQI